MPRKNFEQRLQELRTALQSMAFSLEQVQNLDNLDERDVHIFNLLSPLRLLIAQGGKNLRPRLLKMATEGNLPLEFYATSEEGLAFTCEIQTPGEERWYYSPTGYAPCFIYMKCWSPIPRPGLQKTTLVDWMDRSIYQDGQNEYTRNKLLRAITDKDGGAHLDDIQDFLSFTLQQRFLSFDREDQKTALTGKDLFVIDLAALTTWLGKRMLLLRECRDKGLDESECKGLRSLDKEFDRFRAQNTSRFGWIMPATSTWGQGRIPPDGHVKLRIKISKKQDWWKRDYVYSLSE